MKLKWVTYKEDLKIFSLIILLFTFGFLVGSLPIEDKLVEEKVESQKIVDLIEYEIEQTREISKGWKCFEYAEHYNESLHKYPELDVRWLRYICLDNSTNCNAWHTTIFVAGYGKECILDQTRYRCIGFSLE